MSYCLKCDICSKYEQLEMIQGYFPSPKGWLRPGYTDRFGIVDYLKPHPETQMDICDECLSEIIEMRKDKKLVTE